MTADDTSRPSPCDYFRSVQRHEAELSTADLATFGIHLDGMYLFRNKSGDAQFMSVERIARGFCRLVAEHYPLVLGRPTVRADDGRAVLAVDPDNLCLPDIGEMAVDQPAEAFFETRPHPDAEKPAVRFFNLRRFYAASGVARLPQATYNRDNAAAIVHVIRFQDNAYVALHISLTHVLFDGMGVTAFFRNWAAYTRGVDDPECALKTPPVNDRSVVRAYFDSVAAVVPPYLAQFRELTAGRPMASPANIAPIMMAAPDTPGIEEQHLLHITPARLKQLRQDVDPLQTAFLVLAALLAKTALQANVQEQGGAVPKISYVMIPYDVRPRSTIPAAFSGNASFLAVAPLDSQAVLNGSLRDVASAIAEHSAMTSGAHAKATVEIIENELHVLYQGSAVMCNSAASSYVGLTNLRYMSLDQLDFGWGGPEILACDYYVRDGMMRLHANLQDGGLDIFLNYTDRRFAHLKESPDLLKYVDVIF
ncbi:hypothetical protein H4R18_000939 [Coemansia javaensis]|uniref:Uncharacterized protein n=1 Tax=Coemansia javaensis TaxID=2761396 RepID=A0A9W8HGP1_9FUNG|nr:hypothetical protein H4R18_000939 [Coemansia javaensis]